VELRGSRRLADVADDPVISPLLNTVLAQEVGDDFGDYVLLTEAFASVRRDFGVRGGLGLRVGIQHAESVVTGATPATGSLRPNPPLGSGTFGVAELTLERRSAELALRAGVSGSVVVEGGTGEDVRYLRIRGSGRAHLSVGTTRVVARGWAGWGSADLPAHRSFVMGGRGTLVGEPFRAWGGRYAAVGTLEWQLPIPFPALGLGPFVSTGRSIVLAPFVGAGWAGGVMPGLPWQASDGVRPVVGVGVEWFHRFFRVDVGMGLRDRDVSVVIDVTRDLWDIL
jgi:hypothetical protein